MYTYKQYQLAKFNNSILQRFENLCNALQDYLGMPVLITGLHSGFKNAVSGIERDIKNINPLCVLEFNGLTLDRQACTSIQTVTPTMTVNSSGTFVKKALEYRRLPLNADFGMTIVCGDAEQAIRLSEYLMMAAFTFPHCKGDEHTKTTLIFKENVNTQLTDRNDYNLASGLTANMQVIEPTENAIDDTAYPLVGVGIQRPDGTWDETPKGEIVYKIQSDDNGMPIYDEQGNPMYELDEDGNKIPLTDDEGNVIYGNYVDGGWYRLHVRYHVHAHRAWEECLESEASVNHEVPSGAENLGDIPEVKLPKFNIKTNEIEAETESYTES